MAKAIVIDTAEVYLAAKEHTPSFLDGDDFHSFVARHIEWETLGQVKATELEPLVGTKLATTDPDYLIQGRHAKVTVTPKVECYFSGSVEIFYPLVSLKHANVNGANWAAVSSASSLSDVDALPVISSALGYHFAANDLEALVWDSGASTLTLTAKADSALFETGSQLVITA